MRRFALPLALVCVLFAGGTALADSVYHTEILQLEPQNGATGSGTVVNIHPNGPNVFAHERYSLVDADPNASYAVFLRIFLESRDCSGSVISLNTAQLDTNGAGNGTAAAVLTPENVAGLRGMTFSINWHVVGARAGPYYATRCTVVTLD
jgi:hypothetical protein